MRILVLAPDAFGRMGGIAKFNQDLIRALCAYPDCEEVVAIAYAGLNPTESLPAKLTFKAKGINSKIKYVLSVLNQLTYNSKFDLILCGHIHLLPLAFLSRLFGIRAPIVLMLYGVDAWQPTKSWIANWFAKKINAFISISRLTEKKFMEWTKIKSTQRFLLPVSIKLDHFGPGTKNLRLLGRYGLTGKTILMTLGRLSAEEKYKGVDQILELIPDLAKEIPNVAYLVVGEGSDRTRLQEMARTLGIEDRVVFTGFIEESEKADHLRLADAFVMPGWGEGFGIVYLEALACGIPVVASKVDGSREALLNGQLGILVDPADPEEIKAGFLEALKKPKGVVPDGLSYFSYENFGKRLHQILNEFII